MTKAKQKAQELASAAGIKLGKVVNVSESSSYYPIPMYAQADSAMGNAPKEATTAPNVEPGSQDVTVTMNVIFEVK